MTSDEYKENDGSRFLHSFLLVIHPYEIDPSLLLSINLVSPKLAKFLGKQLPFYQYKHRCCY